MNFILNVVSLVIAFVAGVIMIPGIVPLLGWLNWAVLLVAGFGAVIGYFAETKVGFVANAIVLAIGGLRLFLGGGFV